jgi:hypothetical protein
MKLGKLKAFRPLPPIAKDETLLLSYDDVIRINNTFIEYVRLLGAKEIEDAKV